MNTYPVGEQVVLTGSFFASGAPADPTAVTGELLLPDQSLIALVITKKSTGVYTAPYYPQFASGVVTGAANNGGGLVRLTLDDASKLVTGMRIVVSGVLGTTEANGTWPVTVINGTQVDLQGSTFANAYASGGAWSKPVPNGLHQWRMVGTGAVEAAVEGQFMVQSEFSA